MSDRDDLVALIKDAYYHARDHGGTMHTAADDAAAAVLAAGWRPPAELREPVDGKIGGQRQGGAPTARAALDLVIPKAGTQRRRVLMFLRGGGRTDVELARVTDLPANSVRPRRVELVDAGWVHDSGQKRRHNGRDHVVWTLTPAALERLTHE